MSNQFGTGFAANPFPLFAQLRMIGPVLPLPFQLPVQSAQPDQMMWMITRFEEAVQVLKDHRFSVDLGATPGLGRTMLGVDEPDHTRLRVLVSKAFTPRYVETLRPRIQSLADELLDKVQDRGAMDVVGDYAYPLPINVISEMLGVPPEDRAKPRAWSEMIASGSFSSESNQLARVKAFSEYLQGLVAEKKRHPADDLISQLVTIDDSQDHLTEDELLATIGLLIFAGHETTANLISLGVLALLENPAERDKLQSDLGSGSGGLIPTAVEEILRYCAPVAPGSRIATEDVEIGGQVIHKGDLVMVALISANRDETQFRNPDPDTLAIARHLNRHIAFGQGIHYCLGAPLARLEGEIAFKTLLQRLPALRLATLPESVLWRGNMALRGLSKLLVTF